ncbi:MAG: TIGR04211 family SH3 domain-containing protein [Deltaproteobacteria bacterium]|nr:TIGR04211 family SH3 domain-containing protein [Deltaproteobacteria bacterium]
MKKIEIILMVILFVCSFTQVSSAEKAYVSDSIKITLRSGPSIQNKIITFLSSGQAVEVLEAQDDWSRVQILESDLKDREGWVMNRYLITRLPWEKEALSLRNENEKLKEKLDRIEKEWKELKNYPGDYQKLRKQHEELIKESADYINVKAAYDDAVTKLESARAELQELKTRYESLNLSQRHKWFAAGALVLLAGLLIGLVTGRQQKKRKTLY